MTTTPSTTVSDRECLQAMARRAGATSLRPVVERYLALVYASALRRTARLDQAGEVTRAVFLVLSRRARRLRGKTILAGWLFRVTAVACRKLTGRAGRKRRSWWPRRKPQREAPPEVTHWARLAPELDAALDRLPPAQRDAVLLRTLLNLDGASTAGMLGTSERRATRRVERGLRKVARLLRRQDVVVDPDMLAQECASKACAVPLPEGLADDIVAAMEASSGGRPSLKLARRTLKALAWLRWRRRLAVGIPTFSLGLILAVAALWYVDSLTGHSRLISAFLVWSVRHEARTVPGLTQPARPWPADAATPLSSAEGVRSAQDLYQTTNVWLAHLGFTRDQWRTLQPERIDPLPHFLQPDGTVLLRNPEAQRSGLAGVLGFDFNWTSADFEFGGVAFRHVAARLKGNGTYLSSLSGQKQPFKVDLNKMTKGQQLGEATEFNFNNLVNDFSCMSDALAYEFFREAGVPAPRTAYAYLSVSVEGRWDRKPLGLYVMVEPVDEAFAAERFGSRKTPVFKPVTLQLFEHLGDDWSAYEAIYDLKTKATADQLRRVIEFSRLVTGASDADFSSRLSEFLDLEAFGRFLACEVLLSNYDSFLSNGQNFYLYLDRRSGKFGFIPWDLDLAWGGFFLLGTTTERERASIWHPWVGEHRFLERVMAVEEFRQIYRAHLESLLARLLVPRRLNQRIDELARVIQGPIAAESDFRLRKFEEAVSDRRPERQPDRDAHGANRPAHQIKRFIAARAESVRRQLDGKSNGIVLQRQGRR